MLRACLSVLFVGIGLLSCLNDAVAQTIDLTDPASTVVLEDGDDFPDIMGTCSLTSASVTIKVSRTYTHNGSTITDARQYVQTTGPDTGQFGGPVPGTPPFKAKGPGTWKVEVWITGDPTKKDSHQGTTNGPMGGA